MAKSKGARLRAVNRNNKKRKLGLKPKAEQSQKQKLKKPNPKSKNPNPNEEDPIIFGSGSGSESDSPPSSPTRIQSLLDPYTKPQLISFLLDAAVSDTELRTRIRSLADSDPSLRRIFVHGLAWDATEPQLVEAFSPFGPMEECHVVVDKTTRRAKGYGFVLFKTRAGAAKALKEPQKRVGSRMVSCQLASVGVPKQDAGRKVYVGNVPPDARPEKLREFFGRFGEIELGPLGFDFVTGKSRGYALFIYKTPEEARKVVAEPNKVFEGHQLHCKMANVGAGEGATKTPLPAPVPVQQVPAVVPTAPAALPAMAAPAMVAPAQPQSVFSTVAAAQNLALLSQNPAYAALLAQNPMLAAAAWNPALMNAAAFGGMAGVPYGGGAVPPPYGGGAVPPPVHGAYGVGQGMGAVGLQGYQAGSSAQAGQTSGKAGGALGGYPSSSYV